MGLGSQVALFRANRHRLCAVFRPNVGRVVCAVVLALLVPFGVLVGIPITFLYGLGHVWAKVVSGHQLHPEMVLVLKYFVFLGLPVAYVLSSLIISGVQSRLARIALFGQVWLAVYGTVLLWIGLLPFL